MINKKEIEKIISDFISLFGDTSKENYNREELADIINMYLETTLKKRRTTETYKKAQANYNETYENLLNKVSQEELDKLESSIYKMYEIDGVYLYLQGIIDGKTSK